MRKNAIFFLVDALRYDVFADVEAARRLCPNIVSLIDRGFVRRAVANAQSTQMVMPAIYSLTYPLDHGGYNTGIRKRPQSFVETLRDAGYTTHLMAACNQLGITHGYDRGFAHEHTSLDCRHVLEYLIDKVLSYDVGLWRKGERTREETLDVVRHELARLLDALVELIETNEGAIWSPKLRRINEAVAAMAPAEKALLERDPDAVLDKLARVPPSLYWRFLGRHPDGIRRSLFAARVMASLSWRSRRLIAPTRFPFFVLGHYETKADAVMKGVREVVARSERPWYVHLHVMDVHDCRSVGRPLVVLSWLRFAPRWIAARLAGATRRTFNYDLALMYVDRHFGKLLRTLEATGQLDDTVILVTGDHGSSWAESPRIKQPVADRTHYEDIDVPLILAGAGRQPVDGRMIDSMSVSATLLDALGVEGHASFKGRSAFGPGRPFVITETAGAGNADLERKDLHFTVTTDAHKLMAVLEGSALRPRALYDLAADPKEVRNVVDDPAQAPVIDRLMDYLYQERGALLRQRGADLPRAGRQPDPVATHH